MVSKIPQDFIDQLLDKTDLVELISSRISVKKRGKSYLACCPFHDEKTPSFNINPIKQFYYCFGCSAGGNAINFLMEHDKLTFIESVEDLAENLGMILPKISSSHDSCSRSCVGSEVSPGEQKTNTTQVQFTLLDKIMKFYGWSLRQEEGKVCVDYLKGRGISGDLAKKFQLGWVGGSWDNLLKSFVGKTISIAPSKNNKSYQLSNVRVTQDMLIQAGLLIKNDKNKVYDRFRSRLMFPIRDRRGRVLGFGGRVISSADKPKYLNSPETSLFLKSQVLYGLYEVLKTKGDIKRICVVEGYMDVIGLAQFGINYSVATLGTSTSIDHIKDLVRVTDEIIFCFDGDKAGKAAAWRALLACLPIMSGKFKIGFLFLPDGEDPDSIVKVEGAKGFEARLDTATPLSEVFFGYLSSGVDLGFVDGRALFLDKLIPLLSKVPEGSYKVLLIDMAAKRSGLTVDQIEKQLSVDLSTDNEKVYSQNTIKSASNYLEQAISILLHYPELANKTDLTWLDDKGESLKGAGRLLVKIIYFLQDQYTLNAKLKATQNSDYPFEIRIDKILMHFSSEKIKKRLAELMMIDHSLGHDELIGEFFDLLERFKGEYQLKSIDNLIVKSKDKPLDKVEKDRLKRLLAKHKLKLK